jgi:hypothetical protein
MKTAEATIILRAAALPALLLGCSATVHPKGASSSLPDTTLRVDTAVIFEASAESSGTFPIIADPARTGANAYLADPNAPPCPDPQRLDTSGWIPETTAFRSRYVERITFLMPPGYHPYDWDSAQHLADADSGQQSGGSWARILGSWWLIRSAHPGPRHLIASFAIWIGPRGEYPTSGISPAPRQVELMECRLPVSGVEAHAVLYTLEDSAGARTRNVSAYWPVKEGVWLSAAGDSPEALGPIDFLTVLRSMKVSRP